MRFTDSLEHKVEEIERPPLLPPGDYRWAVEKQASDTIANGDWETCDFTLRLLEPVDVDEADLKEFEEKAGPVGNERRRHRFMFPTGDDPEAVKNYKRTEYNLKRFLVDHLGLEDKGSLKRLLADSVNCQCLAQVRWRADKNNPDVMYDEIFRTAPVE